MLLVKQLLAAGGLADSKITNPSIACISTTRPIYLVFGEHSDYPEYVIRKLAGDHDFETHKVHNHLYKLVGNQVPEPIGIYEYEGAKYDIQRGVKGTPWFQIKSKIRNKKTRTRLEKELWQSLTDFHSAIAPEVSSRTKDLQPDEELLKVYSQYLETEHQAEVKLQKLVELAVSELNQMPACCAVPQHGDFCINNLIIDATHITVIDFEDFSITTMPMYDHFTLALSLPSCSEEPRLAANILKDPRIITAAERLGISTNAIPWHFLHHILLRLGPWSVGEKRAKYRLWLKQVLGSFIEAQAKGSFLQ